MSEMDSLDDKSPEELGRMLDAMIEGRAPEPEPTPVPEVTPEPEREVAPEEPPVEQREPDEPEKKAEPEPDFDRQELLARLEELQASHKALETKLGRQAGEAGYWRQKARASERPEPEPETDFPEDEPVRERPSRHRDATTAWVVSQAVERGGIRFGADHPDAAEFKEAIVGYWQKSGYSPDALVGSMDPVEAERESYRALSEAYWHVKAERAAHARQEVATKRAEQFARQKEAKQRAGVAKSGGAAAPAKPQPKTLDKMSNAELEAEIDRRTARFGLR